jgi:hypothetical protein
VRLYKCAETCLDHATGLYRRHWQSSGASLAVAIAVPACQREKDRCALGSKNLSRAVRSGRLDSNAIVHFNYREEARPGRFQSRLSEGRSLKRKASGEESTV